MAESIITRRKSLTGGGEAPGNYSTWVVEDEDNVKYTIYNGYDIINNPTPSTTNLPFNQWIRNDEATGDVILNNTIMTSLTFNGPDSVLNESKMEFVSVSKIRQAPFTQIGMNNGFIYATSSGTVSGSERGNAIHKYNKTTLELVNTLNIDRASNGYEFAYRTLGFYDGKVYIGIEGDANIVRTTENTFSSLTRLSIPAETINGTTNIAINDGKIYRGTYGNFVRVHNIITESFGTIIGNINYSGNGQIEAITTNSGFVYVGGFGNRQSGTAPAYLKKYRESNYQLIGNTVNYGIVIKAIAINDGFIYVGGTANLVRKYNESTLALVGNTASFGSTVNSIAINNGFIYVSGGGVNGVAKYNESTLAFVGNTANYGTVNSLFVDNNFVYTGGGGFIQKTFERTPENDLQNYYIINKIKVGG
jgi:stage V sporulation protein SpoVS